MRQLIEKLYTSGESNHKSDISNILKNIVNIEKHLNSHKLKMRDTVNVVEQTMESIQVELKILGTGMEVIIKDAQELKSESESIKKSQYPWINGNKVI